MSKTHTAPKERASENKLKINRKRLLASLLALAVLLSVTAFIGYAGSYDKVYPNTYIDGKKAGGQISTSKTNLKGDIHNGKGN